MQNGNPASTNEKSGDDPSRRPESGIRHGSVGEKPYRANQDADTDPPARQPNYYLASSRHRTALTMTPQKKAKRLLATDRAVPHRYANCRRDDACRCRGKRRGRHASRPSRVPVQNPGVANFAAASPFCMDVGERSRNGRRRATPSTCSAHPLRAHSKGIHSGRSLRWSLFLPSF
jgi:hypothetical protein